MERYFSGKNRVYLSAVGMHNKKITGMFHNQALLQYSYKIKFKDNLQFAN